MRRLGTIADYPPADPDMKRTRFSARNRVSSDAAELTRLAIGLAESGSKLEDAFWESELARFAEKMLQNGAEDEISAALDRLFDTNGAAHDELADMIEARAESCVLSQEIGRASCRERV